MTAAGILTERLEAREPRPWVQAFLWMSALGPFFFLTYGFANWFTAQRLHVPMIVFGWEREIPFLSWTILPYWSIDFLYAGSLFLCATSRELRTQVKRLLTAQALSVAGFLLVPLQFSFARPETHGFFGWMFDVLVGFDKPFNQAPSLHLSLAIVLGAKYSAHLSGIPRKAMQGWFVLIGLSTLTTYQHHFIDLPTGVWVGLLCLTIFPDEAEKLRQNRSLWLAACYAGGAAVCVWFAVTLGGAAWFLLWPAGALLVVSGAYAFGLPGLFLKRSGTIPYSVRWLLAPYLAAARLNARWWTRHATPAQEIAPGVWLGRLPRGAERTATHFGSLVDLTAELAVDATGVAYRNVPMLDLEVPSLGQLAAAVTAILELEAERPTLVCCALGYSRSAITIAAWLLASGQAASMDDAIETIRARRPEIVLRSAHRERLGEWLAQGGYCER